MSSSSPVEAPEVDQARLVAYEVIHAVTAGDAYANLVLPGRLADADLTGRDAAFATELTYGTLRRRGTLDRVLAECSRRPWRRVDADLKDALRLGCHQILFMRVPAHAAVATTVDLAGEVCRRGTTVQGFANAVLRAVTQHDLASWLDRVAPDPTTDPVGNLAVRHSHPEWIVRAFAEALGEADTGSDMAETTRALAADNEPAPVHLVARPGLVDRDALVAGTGGSPGPWSPYAVHLPSGDPGALLEVRERRAGVQDEGSQLVALAAAEPGLVTGSDKAWLDMCAGPGGKAALLGSLAATRGAQVTALERSGHRARLVRRMTAGLPVEVRTADATEPVAGGPYDRVLLDAPCSGLGSLRRRPEARWRRTPEDLADLTDLQARLLRRAVLETRPGGVVAFVTCSPHPAETVDQVAALLADPPAPVEVVDARGVVPRLQDLEDGPFVQLWPSRHGTDAMFLALLRRV